MTNPPQCPEFDAENFPIPPRFEGAQVPLTLGTMNTAVFTMFSTVVQYVACSSPGGTPSVSPPSETRLDLLDLSHLLEKGRIVCKMAESTERDLEDLITALRIKVVTNASLWNAVVGLIDEVRDLMATPQPCSREGDLEVLFSPCFRMMRGYLLLAKYYDLKQMPYKEIVAAKVSFRGQQPNFGDLIWTVDGAPHFSFESKRPETTDWSDPPTTDAYIPGCVTWATHNKSALSDTPEYKSWYATDCTSSPDAPSTPGPMRHFKLVIQVSGSSSLQTLVLTDQ